MSLIANYNKIPHKICQTLSNHQINCVKINKDIKIMSDTNHQLHCFNVSAIVILITDISAILAHLLDSA